MQRSSGFTLIELMITVAIVAILVSVALPNYQQYVRRGVRSAGQQLLADISQREEQYFLDARQYANGIGTAAGQINLPLPDTVTAKYQAPVITVPAAGIPAPSYVVRLTPISGGLMTADGDLYINSLGQRWREVTGGDGTYVSSNDCSWEKATCTPH